MNTVQLEAFMAVAETLSFARASGRLNVTQPAVTQQIHALENELGVRLFNRDTHSVTLTDEGLMFINDARGILEIAHRAKDRFSSSGKAPMRDFIIGLHSPLEAPPLATALSRLRQEVEGLHPVFRIIPFAHLYRQLAEGGLDVVLSFSDDEAMRTLVYEEVDRPCLMALVPKAHRLARKRKLTVADLEGERLIIQTPPHCPRAVTKLQLSLFRDRLPGSMLPAESGEAVATLALAGFGIGILASVFMPPDGRISYIPLEGGEPLSYGIYHPKEVDGLTRRFISLLAAHPS